MGNFAVFACEEWRTHCTGSYTCFHLYNEGEKGYEIYKGTDAKMIAYFYCSYCVDDFRRLEEQVKTLKEQGVENIHFSNCIMTCRPKHTETLREFWEKNGFKIIVSAHG